MTLPDHHDDDPRATVPIVLGSNFAQFAIGHPAPAQPPPPDPTPRRFLWMGVALLAVAVAAAFAALAYYLLA